jgi:hypothetical protein
VSSTRVSETVQKASEAISVLRDLGIDDNTILKDLGCNGDAKAQKAKDGRIGPKDQPCPTAIVSP